MQDATIKQINRRMVTKDILLVFFVRIAKENIFTTSGGYVCFPLLPCQMNIFSREIETLYLFNGKYMGYCLKY